MDKKIIQTENAPAPIGPYSQGVQLGNFFFSSGQIAIDPTNNELVTDNIATETELVMQNVKAVVESAGFTMENVLKSTIFIMDMGQFGEINAVYGKYFPTNPPARETVQVAGLPKGVNVEISVICAK